MDERGDATPHQTAENLQTEKAVFCLALIEEGLDDAVSVSCEELGSQVLEG